MAMDAAGEHCRRVQDRWFTVRRENPLPRYQGLDKPGFQCEPCRSPRKVKTQG
jgi:hypothetical protein